MKIESIIQYHVITKSFFENNFWINKTVTVSLINQLEATFYFRVVPSVWYSSVPSICLVCILRVPGVQSRNNFHYIRQLFPNHRRQFQSLRLAGQYNKLLRHNQQRHQKWWYCIWSRFSLRTGTKFTETSCRINGSCFHYNITGNLKV